MSIIGLACFVPLERRYGLPQKLLEHDMTNKYNTFSKTSETTDLLEEAKTKGLVGIIIWVNSSWLVVLVLTAL